MKVCILGDTHFGVRSDSKAFNDHNRLFYETVFFPELIRRNVTDVYQLGDLFDRRKYINFYTLQQCRDYFFDKMQELGIQLHILIGNHDIFWRESLSVNSPDLLLRDYSNITLYTNPTTVKIDNISVDIIPWVCKENEEAVFNFIDNTESKICLGHFEICGFEMYKGVDNHEGISPNMFKKYDKVLSGHFHHRSTKGNITYVGTPIEHTWADCDDPRGFHLMDIRTKELTFIENPNHIFTKVYYDDSKSGQCEYDTSTFNNQHVKIIVVNKTNFEEFDRFVDRVYAATPLEVKIVEDFSEFETQNNALENDNLNVEDTMSLLSQFVDNIETTADKDHIKTLLKTLYIEAQSWENA